MGCCGLAGIAPEKRFQTVPQKFLKMSVCGEKTIISPGRVWVFFFQEDDRPFIVQMSNLLEHATVSMRPGFISMEVEKHGMAEKDGFPGLRQTPPCLVSGPRN